MRIIGLRDTLNNESHETRLPCKRKPSVPRDRTPVNERASQPPTKETDEERRAHEKARNQTPERKGLNRRTAKARREGAKDLGLCTDCRGQTIPNQIRCEACAEKHRVARRKNDAGRREKEGRLEPRGRRNPVRRRSTRSTASVRNTAGWQRRAGERSTTKFWTDRYSSRPPQRAYQPCADWHIIRPIQYDDTTIRRGPRPAHRLKVQGITPT